MRVSGLKFPATRTVALTGLLALWSTLSAAMPAAAGSPPTPLTTRQSLEAAGDAHGGLAQFTAFAHDVKQIIATIDFTPAALRAYETVNEVIQDVDFERFLGLDLAAKLADGRRAFTFSGQNHPGIPRYLIDYHRQVADDLAPYLTSRLGAGLRFSIAANRPPQVDDDRGYGLFARAAFVSGALSHRQFAKLASGLLNQIAADNLRALAPPASGTCTSLTGLARQLCGDFAATWPRAWRWFERYVDLSLTLTPLQQSGRAFIAVNATASLRLDRLGHDYAALAAYLENLQEKLAVHLTSVWRGVAQDQPPAANAGQIFQLVLDTQHLRLGLDCSIGGGMLLPKTVASGVDFAHGLAPQQLTVFTGLLTNQLAATVHGLTVHAQGVELLTHFQDGPQARATLQLARIPPPRFTGALLGFLPPGFIDSFIPGSLAEYGRILTQRLLTANASANPAIHAPVGTQGELVIDARAPAAVAWHSRGSTELVDDFFLKLGMRVLAESLWPSVETLSDLRLLADAGIGALVQDMDDLVRANASPSPSNSRIPAH